MLLSNVFFWTTLGTSPQCTGQALPTTGGCPDFSGIWPTGLPGINAEVVLRQTADCTGEAVIVGDPTQRVQWTYTVNSDGSISSDRGDMDGTFEFTPGTAGCCYIHWDNPVAGDYGGFMLDGTPLWGTHCVDPPSPAPPAEICTGQALPTTGGCPDFSGTWPTGLPGINAEVRLTQTADCTGEAVIVGDPTQRVQWTYTVNSDGSISSDRGDMDGTFEFTPGTAGCCYIHWDNRVAGDYGGFMLDRTPLWGTLCADQPADPPTPSCTAGPRPLNSAGCADYNGIWKTHQQMPWNSEVVITQTGCTGSVAYAAHPNNQLWTFSVNAAGEIVAPNGGNLIGSWSGDSTIDWNNGLFWSEPCAPPQEPLTPGCTDSPRPKNADGCADYSGTWTTNYEQHWSSSVIITQTGCTGTIAYASTPTSVRYTFTVNADGDIVTNGAVGVGKWTCCQIEWSNNRIGQPGLNTDGSKHAWGDRCEEQPLTPGCTDSPRPINADGCADYSGTWNTNYRQHWSSQVIITQTGCTGSVAYASNPTSEIWTFTVNSDGNMVSGDHKLGTSTWRCCQLVWELHGFAWGDSCEEPVEPLTPGCTDSPRPKNADGCADYSGTWPTNYQQLWSSSVTITQTGCIGSIAYTSIPGTERYSFIVLDNGDIVASGGLGRGVWTCCQLEWQFNRSGRPGLNRDGSKHAFGDRCEAAPEVEMPTRMQGGTRDQMENSGPACTQVVGMPCRVDGVTGGTVGRRRTEGLEWLVVYKITVGDAAEVRDAIRRDQTDLARILGEVISEDAGTEIQVLKLEAEGADSDDEEESSTSESKTTATWKIVVVIGLVTLIGGCGLGFTFSRYLPKYLHAAPANKTGTSGSGAVEITKTGSSEWISPGSPGPASRHASSNIV